MRIGGCVILGLLCLAAAPPPAQRPPPPPPPQRFEPRPLGPGAWDRIQDSLDRSTGRITDESTFQLDQIERWYGRRLEPGAPRREFERFRDERDRSLRIEERQRRRQRIETEKQRQAELDRREYELFITRGLSPVASQAYEDEQRLSEAKSQRDTALLEAESTRRQSLRDRPSDRERIEAEYQRRIVEIRERYESERARILDVPPLPTTQPAE